MREIKFRAWNKRNQRWFDKLIEWVFDRPTGSIGQLPIIPDGVHFNQYTGLKDKNGKEIYEKDILREFRVKTAPMAENGVDRILVVDDIRYLEFNERDCEIIGNIYENPDLLNEI